MRRRERYFPSWTGRVSLFFHHGFYVSTAKPDAAGHAYPKHKPRDEQTDTRPGHDGT
jgi:hypothetical protein